MGNMGSMCSGGTDSELPRKSCASSAMVNREAAVGGVGGGGVDIAGTGPGEPMSDDADDQIGLSSKRGGDLHEDRLSSIPEF